MELSQARELAEKVARILLRGARNVGWTTIREQPLMSMLSFMEAAKNRDHMALDPSIKEIILFGSTARKEAEPDDVDLMMFDNGFYSNILSARMDGRKDSYHFLPHNVSLMLTGWFGYTGEEPEVQVFLGGSVDLHVLPVAMFRDPALWRRIASEHRDSLFLDNAFSHIERFDQESGTFVLTGLEYLKEKYEAAVSEATTT